MQPVSYTHLDVYKRQHDENTCNDFRHAPGELQRQTDSFDQQPDKNNNG